MDRKYISNFLRLTLSQGVVVAAKFFLVKVFKRDTWVRFRGYEHPVLIRAGQPDPFVAWEIFVKEEYKTPMTESIRVILDMGANVGYAAVFFAKHYPDAKIICFEPSSDNYKTLLLNTKPYQNIEAVNKGVWSKTTRVDIANPEAESWSYQLVEVAAGGIECVGIDELVQQHACGGRIMAKIDIEGAEEQLFTEAGSWLDEIGCLQIEVHNCWKPVFDTLAKYDYKAHISGENIVLQMQTKLSEVKPQAPDSVAVGSSQAVSSPRPAPAFIPTPARTVSGRKRINTPASDSEHQSAS